MLTRVRAIALPNVAPFELGVVCEVFGIDRTDTGGPVFDFAVCTPTPGTVSTKLGFGVDVPLGLDAAEGADLIAVPAYGDARGVDDAVLEILRQAHARGAWVLSVCSGAFALGQAGLLDGRGCTTHWMYTAELQRAFPLARVDPDVLYVEDDRIVTSAGTAAGIDACLHIVRRELGAGAVAAIARRMIVPPHRDGGQAQYIERTAPQDPQALAGVLAWASEHLDADLSVPSLAARAVMSERSFARRFRAETGTTPAAWVARARLARAQELLETTTASVEEIARACGFGGAAALRHHFARAFSTTPLAYRRRFAQALAG
ncbi:transcriptional regulator, AraC family [Beutenbergia cavernae DSM 12333]|uniref:Transcriptional regulator, AraC family n=1 Tax=Beutenbergia cavernae (strain ATCC BAA-8 / DSM 12333 / CCUG 43141 / JCM 11478 / NBRC 16432 / NCIMB 13614 / HKI 0122) TaxID=471853 RepID=C5C1R3_BEUC1|nr:helix-turn-helix domain-containing protein [Beutenbergia cavernae]ACQ79531.1 transcriptional regulator, AraC family [Beutenbergia cavernae DSM 12333]